MSHSSQSAELKVESGENLTHNVQPLLHEIRHALATLLDDGGRTVIDLRSIPLAPGEEQKLLDKLDIEELPVSSRKYPFVSFTPERPCGDIILEVKDLTVSVNGVKVLDNLNLTVNKGDKIAFVGNGLAFTYGLEAGVFGCDVRKVRLAHSCIEIFNFVGGQ